MNDAKMESLVWMFGLIIFGIAAANPEALIRVLGRGRVRPSPSVFLVFRLLAAFCFFGTIYHLFALYRR